MPLSKMVMAIGKGCRYWKGLFHPGPPTHHLAMLERVDLEVRKELGGRPGLCGHGRINTHEAQALSLPRRRDWLGASGWG